jgi:hypothetical protein
MTDTDTKPREVRRQQRRQQKQEGRNRRADMLLDKKAKERARQDALEQTQATLARRLDEVEARLTAVEQRINNP